MCWDTAEALHSRRSLTSGQHPETETPGTDSSLRLTPRRGGGRLFRYFQEKDSHRWREKHKIPVMVLFLLERVS